MALYIGTKYVQYKERVGLQNTHKPQHMFYSGRHLQKALNSAQSVSILNMCIDPLRARLWPFLFCDNSLDDVIFWEYRMEQTSHLRELPSRQVGWERSETQRQHLHPHDASYLNDSCSCSWRTQSHSPKSRFFHSLKKKSRIARRVATSNSMPLRRDPVTLPTQQPNDLARAYHYTRSKTCTLSIQSGQIQLKSHGMCICICGWFIKKPTKIEYLPFPAGDARNLWAKHVWKNKN